MQRSSIYTSQVLLSNVVALIDDGKALAAAHVSCRLCQAHHLLRVSRQLAAFILGHARRAGAPDVVCFVNDGQRFLIISKAIVH